MVFNKNSCLLLYFTLYKEYYSCASLTMERLRKRKWEVRILKYIRSIEISDSSAMPTQFGDNETWFRFVLVMVFCPWPHRKTMKHDSDLCYGFVSLFRPHMPAPTLLLGLGSLPLECDPGLPHILWHCKSIWQFARVNNDGLWNKLESQKH